MNLPRDLKELIRHIHSTRAPYSKAAQLNDALEQLSESDRHDHWVVVYDFDGRPEVGAIDHLVEAIQKRPQIEAYQQFACTVNDSPTSTTLTRLQAYNHLTRVLHFEAGKIEGRRLLSRLISGKSVLYSLLAPSVYFAGNGLALRVRTLRSAGGFPEPVDDLGLGYRYCMLAHEVDYLPTLLPQARYASMKQFYKSQSFVYSGLLKTKSEFEIASRLSPERHLPALIVRIKARLKVVAWPLRGFVALAPFIVTLPFARGLKVSVVLAVVAPFFVGQLATRQVLRAAGRQCDALNSQTHELALTPVAWLQEWLVPFHRFKVMHRKRMKVTSE